VKGEKKLVTFVEWAELIKRSFERCYWVPLGTCTPSSYLPGMDCADFLIGTDSSEDGKHVIDPTLAQRRGVYKDVFGHAPPRARRDYQLRANFPIAMTVAPELFDPEHARIALEAFESNLLGPLGAATLDPADEEYRPRYDNAEDSGDPLTSKGRNYHQVCSRLVRLLARGDDDDANKNLRAGTSERRRLPHILCFRA
jgi:glycogen debranching enzyme